MSPEDLAGVAKVIIESHPGLYGAEIVQRMKNRFLAAGFNCAAQRKDAYCFLRQQPRQRISVNKHVSGAKAMKTCCAFCYTCAYQVDSLKDVDH